MTDDERIKLAEALLVKIREMSDPMEVDQLAKKFCGQEMIRFMLDYSGMSLAKDFSMRNAQSLMFLGYLVRANEEQNNVNIFQGSALA